MPVRVLIEDGADVVAAVAHWRPDIALLDIGLPGIDGLEVARRLRAEVGGPVVILISTRDRPTTRARTSWAFPPTWTRSYGRSSSRCWPCSGGATR